MTARMEVGILLVITGTVLLGFASYQIGRFHGALETVESGILERDTETNKKLCDSYNNWVEEQNYTGETLMGNVCAEGK